MKKIAEAIDDNKQHVEVLKFDKINLPVPYEDITYNNDERMVCYGTDNLYPNFLLSLYNNSPIHSAIINSKTTYIIGDGLKYTNGQEIKTPVNDSESFEETISKCIKDYLLYNYFCVEVLYNAFNQPISYFWIPAHKIRTNKSKTSFWYSEDWKKRIKAIQYERMTLNNQTATSKIFFFDGYFPSLNNVYPSPEYNGSIKSITTDVAIRDFNLNNIKNQFSVSTLITFFNGSNISDEVKQQVIKDIRQSYQGENGKKVIVDFQQQTGKSADVRNISPGDWDKAYTVIAQNVSDDIYRGHQVTSPMLMGVKTEGQLGGATELETAYEIFKNTYIRQKRQELTGAFNVLFSGSTIITGQVSFTDKALFSTQLSDALKQQVYTINELRKEAGLPALSNGNRLLSDANTPQQNAGQEGPLKSQIQNPSNNSQVRKLTEEDFEKVKHLGTDKGIYEILDYEELRFATDSDISQWIISNDIDGLDVDAIINKMKNDGITATIDELKSTLKELGDSGVINSSIDENGKIQTEPVKNQLPNSDKVFTMYDYQKRPTIKGTTLIPTSRSFCRKIVEANKYYSRQDIQEMTTIFGYSIFDHCGGFYHDPDTGETTNICRHHWVPIRVKNKS
jgi:hypothetical protein